jgi:hypothetical protein
MSHSAKLRVAVACLAATAAPLTWGDITVQERLSFQGPISIANMNGTTTTIIAKDRARTTGDLQFESGFMRTLARGAGQGTEIVRLDQDKVYQLNEKKQTYTETTFEEMRAQVQKAMEQTRNQQSPSPLVPGDEECEWSPPKANVIRNGEKANIAGIQAEHVTVVVTRACKDKKSGYVCDYGMSFDQWLAPKTPRTNEALQYYSAYAQKMGLAAAGSREFSQRAEALFGQYKELWSSVGSKLQEVQGYPVKSLFGLGIGGAQCKDVNERSKAGSQPEESADAGPPTSVGGAIGALGGMLMRKKKAAEPPPAPTITELPGGLYPLMVVSTELLSFDTDDASPDAFEVPPGFKKVKP